MKPFMARAMKPFLDARDGCKARKRWQMEEEPEKPAEDNVQKKVGNMELKARLQALADLEEEPEKDNVQKKINMELKARLQALAEWIEEPEKPTQDNVQKKINMELAARLQALVEWIKEQQESKCKARVDTEQEKVECARQQMQAWMRSVESQMQQNRDAWSRRLQCGVADACMAGLAEAEKMEEEPQKPAEEPQSQEKVNMEVAKLSKGQWQRLSRKLSRKLTTLIRSREEDGRGAAEEDGRGAAEEEAGRWKRS